MSRVDTAPMLRGVITEINGVDAQQVAGDHWVVRGDRGITYAPKKPENATLEKGEWWPEDYSGPPLVSFSAEEAGEGGVKIGDRISPKCARYMSAMPSRRNSRFSAGRSVIGPAEAMEVIANVSC